MDKSDFEKELEKIFDDPEFPSRLVAWYTLSIIVSGLIGIVVLACWKYWP